MNAPVATLNLPLEEKDRPLIAAAIRLGDYLAAQPECTDAQREAIAQVQAALRRLPEVDTAFDGTYGVWVVHRQIYHASSEAALPPVGANRSWRVSLYPWGDIPYAVEIGSTCSDEPRPVNELDETEFELGFMLCAGQGPHPGTFNFDCWIDDTASLDRFRAGENLFEIDAQVRWTNPAATVAGQVGP